MAKSKEPKTTTAASSSPPASRPSSVYTVVARRYRPQQFADLVGQEHVAQALTNAITSGRIAHAYLFTGARGTGKTSTARILAKALNCEQGPTPTPCDRCPMCTSIANGTDVDAIEIDGASNNKVDEARELRSNVGYMPTRGRFKIYIIDEVHMLSVPAFNALLKTIEEPPPHVKFILATTEPHKIPITILSRCQRYDFASVNSRKIFAALQHICDREGIPADDDALRLVARRANGSMRDSQTLLEQLLASAEGRLTAEQVNAVFGTLPEDAVLDLADAILRQDARTAVELIATAGERGMQLGELLDQLIDHWRAMMLVAVGGGESADLSEDVAERTRQHVAGTNLDAILAGLEVLTTTKTKLRGSPHAQVLLEIAVVRLARLADLLSVAELTQWVTHGLQASGSGGAQRMPAHLPPPRSEAVKKKVLTPPEVKATTPEPNATNEESLEAIWERVLGQVGPMLAAHLRQASKLQAISGPNSLVIPFPAAYSAAYDVARGERGQDTVRQAFKYVTGREWTVRYELLPEPPPNGTAEHPTAKTDHPPTNPTRSRNELLALPFFATAGDVLGAQLMRTDDGFDPFRTEPLHETDNESETAPDTETAPDLDEA